MTIHDTPQEITFTTQRDERSGNRLVVTSRVTIGAPGSEIFPLCCPVREEEWIDGWTKDTYDLVYARGGFNEKNCIFQENYTKQLFFGEEGPTAWVTTVHEPAQLALEFLLIFGDIAVLNRAAHLERLDARATACHCTDTMTLLAGTMSGAELDVLAVRMKGFLHFTWNTLKHYCETGEVLKGQLPPPPSR